MPLSLLSFGAQLLTASYEKTSNSKNKKALINVSMAKAA
jgi:hypothetical protein